MIFIKCINESILQVNDKTRIDVSKSFVSEGTVSDVEIEPETSNGFVSVYNSDHDKWFLDWAYETDGTKTISVRITTDLSVKTMTFSTEVLTEAQDNLYSNDSDIFAIESELKKYIPIGKNSYINIHREAQSRILAYLDLKRIWKRPENTPYTKNDINLMGELNKWSLYEAIHIIYTDLFLSVGDKFQEKMNQYRDLRNQERTRNSLRIDKNGDGTYNAQDDAIQDFKTFRMLKR